MYKQIWEGGRGGRRGTDAQGQGNNNKKKNQNPAGISEAPFIFCGIQNHIPHLLPGTQPSFILKSHVTATFW